MLRPFGNTVYIIIPAAGETSAGAWSHHCAQALAILLGREMMTFPGRNAGFVSDPRRGRDTAAKSLRGIWPNSELS